MDKIPCHWWDSAKRRTQMAEGAGARTLGGSHAEIGKTIRLIIASPVHLVGDALAATLLCRADIIVVDVIDLNPHGIRQIADAQPDDILVDLGEPNPVAAARAINAVCLRARLGFALDETDDHVFACATAGFCGCARKRCRRAPPRLGGRSSRPHAL